MRDWIIGMLLGFSLAGSCINFMQREEINALKKNQDALINVVDGTVSSLHRLTEIVRPLVVVDDAAEKTPFTERGN